jgi:hypothetical protein
VDDRDSFAAEDVVEGGGELVIAIVDQKTRPLENFGEARVARLLNDVKGANIPVRVMRRLGSTRG